MSKPIVIFDNESTGADAVKDRIVQFAAIKCADGFGVVESDINLFLKPGIPISPSATAVHGITNEMVADKPSFSDVAASLFKFLEGCDYAGFNILQFDVPMLSEEFGRCGYIWPAPGSLFIDGFVVYRGKERRDLAAAYQFYCDRKLVNAHDGMADVRATREVLQAQMFFYEDLRTVDQIAAYCTNPRAVDLAGKIVLNDAGIPVYAIGKDKDLSVVQHPGFARWMLDKDFPTNTKNVIRSLLNIPA